MGRPRDVCRTSSGRPFDVRQTSVGRLPTSVGRPSDVRWTYVGRPSDEFINVLRWTWPLTEIVDLEMGGALLESIKNSNKKIKFYQASSSEMYGGIEKEPLDENSRFIPKSPYAVSKVFANDITRVYRESYDLFAVNGILFNHESPRRGATFVTRKITKAIGRIVNGLQSKLTLGNLDASRDWGFAGDYVEAMWKMLQHGEPDDFVVATGEAHSVREFLEAAFTHAGLDYEKYVEIDQRYFRPTEVDHLLGDPSKAAEKLGWTPKVSFQGLVAMMVDHDMKQAEQEKLLVDAGHKVGQAGVANG